MTLDLRDYLIDIVSMRGEMFSYKTAYFVKRNLHTLGHYLHVIGHGLHHAADELRKVKLGFKRLGEDLRFALRIQKRKIDYKYDKQSYKDTYRLSQVKTDFIKFIPFSMFILIPGAELLLPAWLMVFPNSIPSQF